MNWSSEPPTKPGYYWRLGGHKYAVPHIVQISMVGPMAVVEHTVSAKLIPVEDFPDPERAAASQWSGPLSVEHPTCATCDHWTGETSVWLSDRCLCTRDSQANVPTSPDWYCKGHTPIKEGKP